MKLSPICWAAAFSAALPCRRALRRGPLAGTGAVQFCVKQSVLCFTLVCCVLCELCESLLRKEIRIGNFSLDPTEISLILALTMGAFIYHYQIRRENE
jgi:hypothetical protein